MRTISNIFEGKASRVIRCLLIDVGKEWTVRDLADKAELSVGYCHAALTTLTRMNYLRRTENNKLVISSPELLLKRWAAYFQYNYENTFLQYYTFEKEVDSFLKSLSTKLANSKYALTSFSAAWLISPYVRPIDVHLYVPTDQQAEFVANAINVKPTDGTGNIKIVLPYDQGVFYRTQTIEGLKVVSNVQLVVDLWNYTSRGEDAAKPIYDLLEKEWFKL